MKYDIVAIGSSAGGIDALKKIFLDFDYDDAAIIIIQHLSANKKSYMRDIISGVTDLLVYEIEDKMIIERGSIYIVPPNYHGMIEKNGVFTLTTFEKVCHARPSIDVTFESISDVFREKVIGVILTGANHDGGYGLKSIKDRGGYSIVQNHKSAEASEMPRYASEFARPDEILDIELIGKRLGKLLKNTENSDDK